MQDRFKFNAIVTGYYDIDTPEDYQEFNPQIYLRGVDILSSDNIGVMRDDLEKAIKEQLPDITEANRAHIIEEFEGNNINGLDDYITIYPDVVYQCTGLKDRNGTLIYEGDIVKYRKSVLDNYHLRKDMTHICHVEFSESMFVLSVPNSDIEYILKELSEFDLEVIGNMYENSELMGDA